MRITIQVYTFLYADYNHYDYCLVDIAINLGSLPGSATLYIISQLIHRLTSQSFFPGISLGLLPLLGLVSGCVLRLQPSRLILAGAIATGLLLIIAGKLLISTEPVNWNNNFYRQGRGGTLLHSGISLLWIALFIGIAYLKTDNAFLKLLNFLSRHITAIYIVQWIVIMWIFRVYGYNSLGLLPSLMAALISSILSFGITWLLAKRLTSKTKYEN
ncbi:hypothetical protein KRR40_40715 [Niabella defluvii]|nr:hypothetical protein KRR40_40715 [Niabella sp. I65]